MKLPIDQSLRKTARRWKNADYSERMDFLEDFYGVGQEATLSRMGQGCGWSNSKLAKLSFEELPDFIQDDLDGNI